MFYISIQSTIKRNWHVSLFIINLVLGLLFCFTIFHVVEANDIAQIDPDGFGRAGRMLYEIREFNTVTKGPLYPAFIALVAWLAGEYSITSVQISQCLLSAFSCLAIYEIFRKTCSSHLAYISSLVWALYPLNIWYIPRLWTETLQTLLISLYTLTLVYLINMPKFKWVMLNGLITGMLALTKGVGLIFMITTPLVLFWKFRVRGFQWAIMFAMICTFILAPWTWRNMKMTHQLLPIHANGGYNFFLGNGFVRNWSQAPLSYSKLKALTLQDLETNFFPGAAVFNDPIEKDKFLLNVAFEEIKQNPLFFLKKIIIQGLTFWYLAADPGKSAVTAIFQIPILCFGVIGAFSAVYHHADTRILLVPVVSILGASVIVFAFARLSISIMPYMIGFATYAVFQMQKKVRGKK